MELYRYRSTERAIEELEKGELYFSATDDLNDPMDGISNIFWEGDIVTWKNLIENYLLNLMIHYEILVLNKGNVLSEDNKMVIYKNQDTLLAEIYKKKFKDICEKVFQNENVKNLISNIKNRKVIKDELVIYFYAIHTNLLNILLDDEIIADLDFKILKDDVNIIEKKYEMVTQLISFNSEVDKYSEKQKWSIIEAFAHGIKRNLLNLKQQTQQQINEAPLSNEIKQFHKNKFFLKENFPIIYVEQIIKNLFPNCYTISFSAIKESVIMWGHYANGHRGVCFVYEFDEENKNSYSMSFKDSAINIQVFEDASTKVSFTNGNLELEKIEYGDTFPQSNFFKNLTIKFGIKRNPEYWEDFFRSRSFKYKEWNYEEEYRLSLWHPMYDFEKDERKKHYNFRHLKGIIFGVRTKDEDTLRIVNIVKEKCKIENRNDFKFYQSHFPITGDKMFISEIQF